MFPAVGGRSSITSLNRESVAAAAAVWRRGHLDPEEVAEEVDESAGHRHHREEEGVAEVGVLGPSPHLHTVQYSTVQYSTKQHLAAACRRVFIM